MSTGIGFKFFGVPASVGIIKKDEQLVAEAIHRIINTHPYERPREPIGCDIKNILFDPNDYVVKTLGAFFIDDAIKKFDSRVSILRLDTDNDSGNSLKITIYFKMTQAQGKVFSTTVTP